MKRIVVSLMLAVVTTQIYAQLHSRNGFSLSPSKTMRVFVVFADVIEESSSCFFDDWPEGELPPYADRLFDHDENIVFTKKISKYYQEASFGQIKVIGDYYPHLLVINRNDITEGDTIAIVNSLNALPGNNIITSHGYSLSDFDLWSSQHNWGWYSPKTFASDEYIDVIFVVWRRNMVTFPTPWGGYASSTNCNNYPIKQMRGFNMVTFACHYDLAGVFRHEFGHELVGTNEYHSGGAGAGVGMFLSNIGGYGIIGSHNQNLDSYNGWDRWWLGWKHPSKSYYISAIDNRGNEVATDLTYGETLTSNEFILRNFAEYGDVIRIKLPYLKSHNPKTRNQYLWIENHQIRNGTIEYQEGKAKDIRFNIQIGNDSLDRNFYKSRTNYFVPLSSFGNHDFEFVPFDTNTNEILWHDAYTTESKSNPFTGYHPLMYPAWDAGVMGAQIDDTIQNKEYLTIHRIYKDGQSACGWLPMFGNNYDAFHAGESIGIFSNPPTVPLLTYMTNVRPKGTRQLTNPLFPDTLDNRYIFLNGLRVDVVQKYHDGSIKVRVVWDDFTVDRDVRWCGPIILTENVFLAEDHKITLDYGLMPTRPHNPVTIDGMKVFADPTVFTCRPGSLFRQDPRSKVEVTNQSALVVESGAVYEINDGAELRIKNHGTLLVKSGGTLRVKGRGHVEVEEDGYICFEEGANIALVDGLSTVNLAPGFIQGTYYSTLPMPQSRCRSVIITSFPHTGLGSINILEGDIYLQNMTFNGSAYRAGNTIKAGNHVTNQIPFGDVIVNNGADVILRSLNGTTLDRGFEVKHGGKFEVR